MGAACFFPSGHHQSGLETALGQLQLYAKRPIRDDAQGRPLDDIRPRSTIPGR